MLLEHLLPGLRCGLPGEGKRTRGQRMPLRQGAGCQRKYLSSPVRALSERDLSLGQIHHRKLKLDFMRAV